MTDYNTLKVADLRVLLKERGIASTGLTRKAQIVEKLEEDDKNKAAEAPGAEPAAGAQAEQLEAAVEETGLDDAQKVSEGETPVALPAQTLPASPSGEVKESIQEATMEEKKEVAAEEEEEAAREAPAPESATEAMDSVSTVKSPVRTPSPAPNEKLSVETPMIATETPKDNDAASVGGSRIEVEELEADKRKRKRRSTSPDIPAKDIKAKKPRPSDDAAPDVHLKEDEDVVMEQRAPEEETAGEKKVEGAGEAGAAEPEEKPSEFAAPKADETEVKELPVPEETVPVASEKKEKDARYKDLFKPAGAAEAPTSTPAPEVDTDEGPIIPALHVATPALYIRDLMRPLRVEALRNHLVTLATPPSAAPDPSILITIFLDSLKSHALVLFTTTKAASRVRASLHNTVWPAESQRKPLWIDFVPEDKIKDWIQEEEDHIAAEKAGRAAGKPIPPKRFEVAYPVDPQTGEVTAIFQEVGAAAPRNAPKGPRASIDDRRRSLALQREPQITTDASAKRDLGKSFQTLDQLFLSTTTKPKLYYLPVSDARADRRRDDLDDETARDWRPGDKARGRGAVGNPLDRKLRYSFDQDDRVVEVGGDFGPWADDSVGGPGARGGFRGGGGFRSDRGGFRGGRGGWRGGH